MTISTEPLYLGARYVQIKFFAAPRNPGDPSTIVGTLTLMPDENVLVLDALKGDKGDPGDPSPFWRPEWASTITSPGDLAALDLGTGDAGRAWYISGYWHVWTGDEFKVFLGAIPGPPGVTPVISITAQQIEADPDTGPYVEVGVVPTGSPEFPHYELSIPGIPGPAGTNATILEAADFFGDGPLEGDALLYSENAGGDGIPGFYPGAVSPYLMTWITFPEASFGPAGTFAAGRTVVLSGQIPAQPNAYYPIVDGQLVWGRDGAFNSAEIEIEVRWLEDPTTDAPETGELIGRALYNPSTLDTATVAHIHAQHSNAAFPSRAVSPDTSVGRVPADTAIRISVIIYRGGGSGNYTYWVDGSYLSVEMHQVP